MRKFVKMSLAAATMMGVSSVSAQAADNGLNILDNVKFKAQLRPRYQFTDDKTSALDAGHTLTNRTNINLSADLLGIDGLKATVELNAVNDFGGEDSTGSQHAGEADVAKMSQSNITYTSNGHTAIVGRTVLNLDNQRFVGSVGWKQNFQTLDLAGFLHRGENFEYTAAYVYGVNAIGDDGNGGSNEYYGGGTTSGETESIALNASYKISDPLKVTAYAYMLGSFGDTYGVAASGKIALGDGMKLNYRAEYAMLTDASMETSNLNKPDKDADYMSVELGMNMSGLLVGVNYEVQSGDSDAAGEKTFKTPLATKHKFNGWADIFLGTPTAGLVDMNLMVGYKAKGFGVAKAIYHDFSSDVGSTDYGTELDLLYKNKIPGVNNLTGMLKGAMYMDDGHHGDDVTKVWLMLDYKFASK